MTPARTATIRRYPNRWLWRYEVDRHNGAGRPLRSVSHHWTLWGARRAKRRWIHQNRYEVVD